MKTKTSAINHIFILFLLASILVAGWQGKMKEITDSSFDAAKGSVSLAIGMIGVMALWLGLVRILEAGGAMFSLANLVKPLMRRLFPDVPADHPAMGAMMLNMSANMLGLGNAATPFGIRAMMELNRLNPLKGTATNAMCTFLAINTSSVALLPLGVIGVRAAAGSSVPASIFVPTILATLASTMVAITFSLALAGADRKYKKSVREAGPLNEDESVDAEQEEVELDSYEHLLVEPSSASKIVSLIALVSLFALAIRAGLQTQDSAREFLLNELMSNWLMPFLMLVIICYGLWRGVKIYDAVCEGAKQGFDIAVKIIPYLVAILVAIAMFRASGAMGILEYLVSPITSLFGLPADVLPMAIVRPLSGSGAFGVMSAIVEQAPDSYSSYVASTMMGSTETTFYVLAVYFGAVGVTKIRHAVVAALLADITGVLASCYFCSLFWQV
jgi:spore maturation protein SpmA